MADRSLFAFQKKSSFFVQKTSNFPENNKETHACADEKENNKENEKGKQ